MEKNIRRILLGRAMSAIGDGLFLIALPLYLYDLSHSLLNLGLFFMLIKLPSMLLLPKIGLVVERVNKKHAMVWSDYASAAFFACLALLQYWKVESLYLFGFFSICYVLAGNVFQVSSSVLFTQLTTEENRLQVNSYKSILDNVIALSTPALGALLYSLIGMLGVLLINVASFFVSACIECFIQYREQKEEGEEALSLKDYKKVYHWLLEKQEVGKLLLIVMLLNFFVAPNEEVMFVGVLLGKYQVTALLYGISSSIFIVGSLVASVLVTKEVYQKRALALQELFVTNSGMLALIGVASLALKTLAPWEVFYGVFLLLIFCIGMVTTFINVPLVTRFQTDVPVEIQGRFFATLSLGSSFLIPLGIFVAGMVSNGIGADVTLVIYNVIVILLVLYLKPESKDRKKERL